MANVLTAAAILAFFFARRRESPIQSLNTYVFERYFWVPIAFAVGIQMRRRWPAEGNLPGDGNRVA